MIKQFLVVLVIASVISAQAEAQQLGAAAPEIASESQSALPATNSVSEPRLDKENKAPVPKTHTIEVPRRAGLKFVTLELLSSETSKVGDDVPVRLDRDLVINNMTVLPAGTIAHGRVVEVKKQTKCKNGQVHWKLETIPFPDGSTAKAQLWGVGVSEVPERLFKTDEGESFVFFPAINEWWEVILSLPIYAMDVVNLAILSPFLLLAVGSGIGQDSCTTPGKIYELAAGSSVAVMVTKAHKVTY